jgi:hypothetical protein
MRFPIAILADGTLFAVCRTLPELHRAEDHASQRSCVSLTRREAGPQEVIDAFGPVTAAAMKIHRLWLDGVFPSNSMDCRAADALLDLFEAIETRHDSREIE